jgi:hypothetical protein
MNQDGYIEICTHVYKYLNIRNIYIYMYIYKYIYIHDIYIYIYIYIAERYKYIHAFIQIPRKIEMYLHTYKIHRP